MKIYLYTSLNSKIKILLFGIMMMCMFIVFNSCSNAEHKHSHEKEGSNVKGKSYTCPMHPEIREKKPGSCPICKMDLIEVEEPQTVNTKETELTLEQLIHSGNSVFVSSAKTIKPERKSMEYEISAPGYINYDTRLYHTIYARASGRIEKMYVKYAFQNINKGDKLFDIYSEELVNVQRDLIFLLSQNYTLEELKKTASLIEGTRERLHNLGLSKDEIDKLERSKKPYNVVSVYSPYEGHIHEMQKGNMISNDGMSNTSIVQNPRLALKEGMYVEKGMNVFNVVYPHTVWAFLNIYQEHFTKIQSGQKVEILLNDRKDTLIKGKIDFIEPIYIQNTKSLNAIVYLENFNHRLKVGQLITAKIKTENPEGLWVPKSSVINLGKRSIVWVQKSNGIFAPREIIQGSVVNSMIEVQSGLAETDEIVVNAAFIADSESFIKQKLNENE